MSKLLNQITESEYDMIDYYRTIYADVNPTKKMIPAKDLLSVWETNKEGFLGKIFKHSLILEKPVEVVAPENQLEAEIYNTLLRRYNNYAPDSEEKKAVDFIRGMEQALYLLIAVEDCDDNKYKMVKSIGDSFYPSNFVKNRLYKGRFDGCSNVSVKLSFGGKSVTISTDMKLTKILRKVNELLNICGLEEFLTVRSRILNTSKLRGTLCISIHPLDYITMSDNNCDWSSCMSWHHDGEYRQGTVEMMNSPYIVVGYLKSSTPMIINNGEWNSKKYRSLYYVSPNVITNIKGYPYKSTPLDKEVITWLKRLVENAYEDIKYQDNIIDFNSTENDFILEPVTDLMYNDCFGCKDDETRHIAYLAKGNTINLFDFCYSGPRQCMQCGQTYAGFYDESALVCNECNVKIRCEYCGDFCDNEEETHVVDGMTICDYCYDAETTVDDITKERFFNSECATIYIINAETGGVFEILGIRDSTLQAFKMHMNEYLTEPLEDAKSHWTNYIDIPYNKITQKGWEFLFPDEKDREEVVNRCKTKEGAIA